MPATGVWRRGSKEGRVQTALQFPDRWWWWTEGAYLQGRRVLNRSPYSQGYVNTNDFDLEADQNWAFEYRFDSFSRHVNCY